MFWVVLPLAALMCIHLYQRSQTRRERLMLAHLPNYSSLPFIGSAYKFLWDRNFYNHYIKVSNIIEETGQPFVVWFGNHCFIVLSDPEEIRIVSNTNLEKSYFYDFVHCVLGNGLITAPGATWRHSIKKLGNVFRQSNIEAFQDIFNKQSQILVDNLQIEVNGGPFELQHKYLTNVTLKAVAESTLGVSTKSDIIDEKFTNAFIRIVDIFTRRATNICLHFEAIFRVTPAYKEIQESSSIVKNITLSILKQKIADMAEKHEKFPVDTGNINFEKMSTKSFLEILLEMSENDSDLTDEQMKDEVTTILLAGQETTASTLNFVLLVLGIRQDVQNKLYDEILQVIGDRRRPVTKEDLKFLTYCEAVIYETLRLYPPVPAILRRVDHEVQIKSCTIPKGSTCAFNIWGSGRSERVWGPDAMVYKPERWLDPITASKNASSLLNFSVGKRVCIGRRYAVNIVKTMLVYCLTEFEFTSEFDKMVLQMDILLRPISGNLLKIKRRKTV